MVALLCVQSESKRSECRYDWHQTGGDVYVTVYAKGALPHLTSISLNPVRLAASITYSDNLLFELDLELTGVSYMHVFHELH